MATAKFDTEKFTGKNDFALWRIKMKAILIQQGLADALKNEKLPKEGADSKKHEEMLQKAHSAIILCLGDKVLREVAREETAAGVWAKLESIYMTKSLANRLYMKQRLYSYIILEDKSILDQLDEFSKALDDLEDIDVSIEDEDKAIMLLNALPKSYDHMKDAMLYGRDSSITLEEVINALRSKELQKSAESKHATANESLNVKGKFTKGKFKKGWKDNKKQGFSKQKEEDGKETRTCHYCKKPGHLKKDCYSWKRKQAQKPVQKPDTVDVAEQCQETEALNIIMSKIGDDWILDSGCTFHMCYNKSWFSNLQVNDLGSVILGNDQVCMVKGIGSIKLRLHSGRIRTLSDVRYIPSLKRNLISLGMLQSKGYEFKSAQESLLVFKGSEIILKGIRKQSLYHLIASTVVGESEHVVNTDLNLWHLRLGHVSEKGLAELRKQDKLQIPYDAKLDQCNECDLGKSKKLSYPKGKHLSTMPLEYIHCDLWGPSRTTTIGGGNYFISLIDDFSRKVWVYVIKHKSDAFDKFVEWCREVENEKDCRVKCLRTDNGLEFLSERFQEYCKSKGIKRHLTVPGNPQQNGVVERMNRTLLERVRCMLFSSGLPRRFWEEAVVTTAYLINRCPSSAIGLKIPEERWNDRITNYSNLRKFGCLAYVHVKQDKLEPRALRCVLIGYPYGVKGYKFWCIEKGKEKAMISRDAVFREEIMPFLKKVDMGSEPSNSSEVQVESHDTNLEENSNEEPATESVVKDEQEEDVQDEESDLSSYRLARDRARRVIKPPVRFGHADQVAFALNIAAHIMCQEPKTYQEAVSCSESKSWIKAMKEEIDSLMKNRTWKLVNKPRDKKCVSCKWIYKKKVELLANTEVVRYKARLLARGFTQQEGIDFNEIFSPVVKHCSIRLLLALVNQMDLELHQLDVKTAFLNGELEETIFMNQPEGFEEAGSEEKVCLLERSLYGLKQSPRQWNKRFDEFMVRIGFYRSAHDRCVYLKKTDGDELVYLLLYVDDMLVASKSLLEVKKVKVALANEFEMKDLGVARRILGMDIQRNREAGQLMLLQSDYIKKILKKFNMDEAKAVSTPLAQHVRLSESQRPQNSDDEVEMSKVPYANVVGSIMYSMICTRPDLAHSISVASRFMSNPGKAHWEALKVIMRYLKSTSDVGLFFSQGNQKEGLLGYVDSDYASNVDTRKSQTGFVFTLFGTAVSWKSLLQHVVALSTTEAKYMAVTEAVKEGIWLRGMLHELDIKQDVINILCDSQSAIHLVKHQTFHERSKHIDVRLHFVRDIVEKGTVKVVKVSTEENAADMLTKALPASKFKYCNSLVSLCSLKESMRTD